MSSKLLNIRYYYGRNEKLHLKSSVTFIKCLKTGSWESDVLENDEIFHFQLLKYEK